MAKNTDKQKKTFFDRFKKFFLGIYTELKLVVWPTKKSFQQSLITVLVLCFISGLLIFVVDSCMQLVLNFTGFNDPVKRPAAQAHVGKDTRPTGTVKVSEPQTTSQAPQATTAKTTTK